MIRRLVCALALVAATTAVTAPVALADEALVANPALSTVALTLVAKGRPYRYTVEVARSPTEQARGLMLRKTMGRGHGMLFPVAPPREAVFWMEGTIMPLDIIFIRSDRTVNRIAANAVPFDKTEIASGGPIGAVLELNAGEAARIGLRTGDAVQYTLN